MILTCGEALIDMLPRTSTAGEACFAPLAGGSVFNTTIALGRLGTPVSFFSGISTDMLGQVLADELAASKVDPRHLVRSGRPTTVAFVKLVDGQATYAFYDEGTAGRMLAESDIPALDPAISTCFFGSISLVNTPGADTYEALQIREAEAGQRVIAIDPNIRPGFVAGREGPFRERIGRMIARAHVVKLSDEDLHWLEGEGDLSELARGILARGPKVVFVTEGGNGARALTATSERRVAGVKVTVADTVGAGDTFSAGLLTALHRAGKLTPADMASLDDATLDACLNLGVRAAAITVSRAGANPPWAHEL